MEKTDVKVTILGLTRASASMGAALRKYSEDPKGKLKFVVTGQDGERKLMQTAQHFGCVDAIEGNARTAVRGADIVICALAAGVIDDVYEYFAPNLKAGAVVLDMSTAKLPVVALAEKHFPRSADGGFTAYLVGIQPLINIERLFDGGRGVEAASADMFSGSEMIISPHSNAPEDAVKLATDLADILDMTPKFIVPEEYDGLANFTEHLPTLLGLALFATLQNSHGRADLERVVNVDFARILQTLHNYEASDLYAIWLSNREVSRRRIDDLMTVLQNLRDMLSQDDSDEARTFFKETLDNFILWQEKRRSGDWGDLADPLVGYSTGSVFSNLFGFGARGKKG